MLGNLIAEVGYTDYSNVSKDHEKTIAAQKYLLKKHEKLIFLTVSFVNPHNICELTRADAV